MTGIAGTGGEALQDAAAEAGVRVDLTGRARGGGERDDGLNLRASSIDGAT